MSVGYNNDMRVRGAPKCLKRRKKMASTKFTRQGTAWTKEDVRALKKLFGNNSNTTVATQLERTPKSIERKASKLGLNKTKKYLRSIGRSV